MNSTLNQTDFNTFFCSRKVSLRNVLITFSSYLNNRLHEKTENRYKKMGILLHVDVKNMSNVLFYCNIEKSYPVASATNMNDLRDIKFWDDPSNEVNHFLAIKIL